MGEKDSEYPDELINLEGYFLDDYEEMNKFIIFFRKLDDFLRSNEKLKVKEVNPPHDFPESFKILPFSFIILINSREFLLFVINSEENNLTDKELDEYKTIFLENPSQVGIIIVWNNKELSAVKLEREQLYGEHKEILETIEKERQPLKELINGEVETREKFLKVIKTPIKDIKEMKKPKIIEDFNQSLKDKFTYYKTRSFRGEKRDLMQELAIKEIEPIFLLFRKYMKEEIDITDLDDIIKRLKVYEEEKFDK